jgi:acyl carrier protein
MRPTKAEIESVVVGILTSDDEMWSLDPAEIRPQARLNQDLGLDSIQVLHVIASIQQDLKLRHGRPFQDLLVQNDKPTDVTLGQMIDFVYEHFEDFLKAPEVAV